MKAVLYCRVSTKEQTQNLSLPTQLRSCREYCRREGFEIAAEFEDAGESAKTIDRPEFRRLLEYCRVNKKHVGVVVVYNLSRFSRNTHDHAVVRTLLLKLGVSLRSVMEQIGDDSVGRLTENMLAAVAQFENDQKSERTKAGMREAVRMGRWTWLAPLGFLNGSPQRGEPSLLPDPERAPFILRAFELVASGDRSMAAALDILTAAGLRSRKGKPVTPQTFTALLRNPIYAGYINAPAFSVKNGRGDFQPLVPEHLFNRVQRLFEKSGGTHRRDHPDFPLRRFVACGECGLPLTGSSPKGRSRRYPYYHCRKCCSIRVRKERLEAQFVQLLESLKPEPGFMALFRAIVADAWEERRGEIGELQTTIASRLEELKRREALLESAFVYERRIDATSYERQRDRLREDAALAEIELEDARLEELDVEGLLGFAEHVLRNAARLWLDSSPDQRTRLQQALFPNGLTFKDGRIGTAVTCLAFVRKTWNNVAEEAVASPTGFEPVF